MIVGIDTVDDAGVYRLTDEIAMVQTVDFFSPVVDDPYLFGKIAAVNALSDVWAMGGEPITALSIAAFPVKQLPMEILGEIVRGGADMLASVGVTLLGGHTVDDEQLKFGYAVTGTVHPQKVITNAGAQPGDLLILTKPLGSGIISSAIKFQKATPEAMDAVVEGMITTNQQAARAMQRVGVHAATDVTGFGLLGHAYQLAKASKVTLHLAAEKLPLLPQVISLIEQRVLTKGDRSNREYVGELVAFDAEISGAMKSLMFDPQTAGGMLISVAAEKATELVELLQVGNGRAWIIGQVVALQDKFIQVSPNLLEPNLMK